MHDVAAAPAGVEDGPNRNSGAAIFTASAAAVSRSRVFRLLRAVIMTDGAVFKHLTGVRGNCDPASDAPRKLQCSCRRRRRLPALGIATAVMAADPTAALLR